MIGKTLGHYEILDLLGTGGMGEVYRARDQRLGRDVAIKVLPEAIAGNPEVQSRFQREATTISSLNHPHICVLHDVGQEGDVRFLVMELVDGITLAQRLRKGPLPLDEVLRYGAQIADALDRAHRAGVIHRDLKPGNVMLTKAGAKLMDFGLARVNPETSGAVDVTVAESPASPTVAHPLTAEGAIVGTFQYMAPEQLEGQEVDRRSDLWALGCVIYEMATGRRAFEGRTQASLIGSIMHHEPDPVSRVTEVSPPELDRLVQACLAKDPDDRIQSAHDVRLQLEWLAGGTSGSTAPKRARGGGRWTGIVPLAVVAVVAGLTGAFSGEWLRGPDAPDPSPAPEVYEMGRWTLASRSAPIFSPDGRAVLFAVEEGNSTRIYRRDLAELEAQPLRGTEEGRAPFFSPDGNWIAFVTPNAVKKVPASGGIAQVVLEQSNITSGTWGSDGRIYLGTYAGGEMSEDAIVWVPEGGGAPRSFARLDSSMAEGDCWLPQFLPDGRTMLASIFCGKESTFRIIAFAGDGSRKLVRDDAFLGLYSRTGHLLYRDGSSQATVAAPFDPDRLEITGSAVALTEVVDGSFCFGISGEGRLAYVPTQSGQEQSTLEWIEPDGTTRIATAMASYWAQPRISPDQQRVVVRKVSESCELWLLDVARQTFSRLIQDGDTHDPVWSSDGRQIVFLRSGVGELVSVPVAGDRRPRVLLQGSGLGRPASSGGDNLLAFTRTGRQTRSDIWLLSLDGDPDPREFLATEADESDPQLSPDGEWIAYVTDETGTREVMLRRRTGDGGSWQVSAGGGAKPAWGADGGRVYYVAGDRLMAVDVTVSPQVSLSPPKVVFAEGFGQGSNRDFSVAADGSILRVAEPEVALGHGIRMLIDWPGKLARLGGGG